MSDSLGSQLFVPFDFPCVRHPQNDIMKVNLLPGIPQNNRLLCSECPIQNQSALYSIGQFFQFLSDTKTKYTNIKQDLNRIRTVNQETKEAIIKYLQDQNELLQNFETSIDQIKLIKDDLLEKYLQRQEKYKTIELAQFLESLTDKVKIVNGDLKFIKPFWTTKDQEYTKGMEKYYKDLQKFVKNLKSPELKKIEPEIPHAIKSNELYLEEQEIAIPSADIIEFNSRGNLFAIATEDSFLQIWQLNESNRFTQIQTMKEHTQNLKSISFSFVEDSFVTGSADCSVILWKQIPSKTQWILALKYNDHSSIVNCLSFSHNDQYIATGSQQIIIYKKQSDQYSNQTILNIPKNTIQCISFNGNDNILVSSDTEKVIAVSQYENDTWQMKHKLNSATQIPIFLSFNDLNDFFSVSDDNEIIFWLFSDETDEYECKILRENIPIQSVTYCRPLRTLVICYQNSVQINLLDRIQIYQKKEMNMVCQLAKFSREGQYLAFFGEGKMKIYKQNI